MLKAVLYLRLSKEDIDKINKGDDSESIVNQRILLMDYALEHDMQVVKVYSDDDFSGLYDDRPAFNQLIHDAKLGLFDVVLAKTQARFTRNMEHVEKYFHHDFPLLGIRFIGVVDGVDTNVAANKKSRQVNGLVNEWYCEDLSNNIRSVFKQKMKKGQFLGAFAPYGYLKDPQDHHKFIIDDYAADVVRKIYSLFLSGYNVNGIAFYLEDHEILNPTLYKKSLGLNYKNVKADEFSSKYNLWSTTTVKRILTNEVYLGTLTQGTYEKLSYKDKKVVPCPRDKWIVIKNHHEAIIDTDTFNKVQTLRSKRRICTESQGENQKVHIFAGKLRCATCGHTMIKSGGVRGRKDDWYLRCQLANKSRKKECTSHNIRYSVIEETVHKRIIEIVNAVASNPNNFNELKKVVSQKDDLDEIAKEEKTLKELELKLEKITKSVEMLYEDRLADKLEEDMFFRLKDKFEKDASRISKQKLALTEKILLLKDTAKSADNLEKIVTKHIADYSTLTHEIVNDFIDYIEIEERDKKTGKQNIIIHWNF